ncbi:hypothetical protein F4803DRAFT_521121, partial [Xylaria telfairii]
MPQPIVPRGIIMMSILFSFFATTLGSDTPSCKCNGLVSDFFIGDLDPKCSTEKFSDLGGHPVLQLLYDVMMQSTLPNETVITYDVI